MIPSGEVYTEATKGNDVTFRYTVNPEYSLNGNPTFTGVTVSADDRKKGYFKMVIEDSDITVTFPVVKNRKIEVGSNPDVESCKIAINSLKKESEYCAPNAKFTITPKRKKGKLAVSARVIASDGTAGEFVNAVDDGFGTVSIELRMPASGDCKVEIKSEAGVSVTAEESENGTLKLYRDCFRKGEKVNFEYPQCTEEIVYTYSRETDIASSVEVKDSCDELKTSDLVSGYKDTLSGLLSLIGSNLDLVPILGGKESVCGLYYSDGVDSEGEVTKERYYGLEYRVTQGKKLQRTTLFESKLEAAGFTKGTESGTIFGGDTYSKVISVKGEEKTRRLEVGYSATYSTLAIAISHK